MLNVAICKIETTHLGTTYFAQTETGDVPEHIPAFPDNNHDLCFIKVFPVIDEPDIETYGERTNAEEVHIALAIEGVTLPKNVRWFVRRK